MPGGSALGNPTADSGAEQVAADGVSPYLYWGFGGLLLLPLWIPAHFATEDGYPHLYWVEVYRALGNPDHALNALFVRNVSWDAPHHLVYFGMQYALGSVLGPHLAQKVIVSLIIVSWVGAIHLLARSISGRLTLGAFAALLLVHSSWLYNGFFAFMGAMPLALVVLAMLARLGVTGEGDRGGPVHGYLGLGLLGLGAHYAHFFVGALILGIVALYLVFPWGRLPGRRAYLVSAMLPTAALAGWYLTRGGLGTGGLKWESVLRVLARFFGFGFFRGLAAPTPSFWLALAAFAGAVAYLCWTGVRAEPLASSSPIRKFVLLLALLLSVAYFFAPAAVGEAWPFHARLQYAALACLLPILRPRVSRRARAVLLIVVSLLLGWQVLTFTGRQLRFSREYVEVLRQAAAIPRGAMLASSLQYGNARYDGSFVRVLAGVPEDIAYRRHAALVSSFFPARPYYWIRPKPGAAPAPELRIGLEQSRDRGLTLLVEPTP